MYNKSNRVKYNTNNFKAYGLVNNIVKPEESAFTESTTEKSDLNLNLILFYLYQLEQILLMVI